MFQKRRAWVCHLGICKPCSFDTTYKLSFSQLANHCLSSTLSRLSRLKNLGLVGDLIEVMARLGHTAKKRELPFLLVSFVLVRW